MTETQAIRERWREVIPALSDRAKERVNGEPSWVCPLCGHGSNGDGLTLNPTGKHDGALKCFGCGFSGDILDLWQQVNGVDFKAAKADISSLLGIAVSEKQEPRPQNEKPMPVSKEQGRDFEPFFLETIPFLRARFPEGYRGISLETLAAFRCGYAEKWKHPDLKPETAGKVPPSPRLIVPTSRKSYIAVDVRADIPEAAKPYRKQKAGAVHWLNTAALGREKPCFVVEGEFDALSIIDAGGAAVGIGSINQRQKFLEAVKGNPPTCPIILALDNDEPGRKAQMELAEGMRAAGIPFLAADTAKLYGGGKDANDALQADRRAFKERLVALTEQAAHLEEMTAEEYRDNYSMAGEILGLIAGFEKAEAFSSTGFNALDKLLGGGLFAGLYIVGAISSLGKTTFCCQIADAVAAAGHDVLFFSLEMSRGELAAKSLSRLTAGSNSPCSTRDILTGGGKNPEQKAALADAVAAYQEYANRLFIVEGVGDVTAARIRERVQEHIRRTNERPLVVVDYLQIIAGADVRESDKQRTDKAVLELKRISRDFDIPVLVVSSFNRENYSSPVNMTAFKESGAVEYSADVLIGLQFYGMDYRENEGGERDKARMKRIRELFKENRQRKKDGLPVDVQCKILKNRNGLQGDSFFEFTARHNLYKNLAFQPEMKDCPIDFGDFLDDGDDAQQKAKSEFGGRPVGKKKAAEIAELFEEI